MTERRSLDKLADMVVAPYPPTDEPDFHDSRMDEEQKMDEEAVKRAAESQAQLCSFVPVALRVQRQVSAPPSSSIASVSSATSVVAPYHGVK